MTAPTIYEWPADWYRAVSASFFLSSRNQTFQSPWSGRKSVYGPHSQFWMCKMTLMTLREFESPKMWEVSAFFSRLDGQNGLLRIGAIMRMDSQYNLQQAAQSQAWSDGTIFTDGTGWQSNLLPPTAFVAAVANSGDKNLVIGGLPASVAQAIRPGDLFEVRPNGVSSETPNLYEVQVGGSTDANGKIGVEVRPRLRMNFAVGDTIVLKNATSVFHVVDDNQGEIQITGNPINGNLGFTLIEALP